MIWLLGLAASGGAYAAASSSATAGARLSVLPDHSLADCYEAALRRSEAVAASGEQLEQARERESQGRGAILPTVTATASYLWQQTPESGLGASFFPNTQPLVKLTATQPLFRGLREFAGIRQLEALSATQQAELQQARTQLYRDVAVSFYGAVSQEQDLRDIDAQLAAYGERERELQARVKIGRSRPAEVLSVKAAAANLAAQKQQLEAELATARETLSFLTGLRPDVPLEDREAWEPGAPGSTSGSALEPLENFLALIDRRPDVQAEVEREAAAQEAIAVARGAHWPSADLIGNTYLVRSGTLKDVHWDLQVGATIPLYAGGVLSSRVREAVSRHREAELAMIRARRLAEQEVRTAYQNLQSSTGQLRALSAASKASEKSYRQQSQDYRLGLVSNIDVLQALTGYQESRRLMDRARFAAKLERVRLEIAVARRPAPAPETAQGMPSGIPPSEKPARKSTP